LEQKSDFVAGSFYVAAGGCWSSVDVRSGTPEDWMQVQKEKRIIDTLEPAQPSRRHPR
jgi:hypothetical protein